MKSSITVDFSIIRDKQLNADEVHTLIGLLFSAQSLGKKNTYFVNYEDALYSMYEKLPDLGSFKLGVKALEKKGLIKLKEDISSVSKVFSIPFISKPKPGFWMTIKRNDILKITSCKRINKKELLRFYILLLSMRDVSRSLDDKYKFKIVNVGHALIEREVGLSDKTVSSYLKLLSSKKLIVVAKPRTSFAVHSYFRNLYAAYEDKDILTSYVMNEYIDVYNVLGEDEVDEDNHVVIDLNSMMEEKRNNSRKRLAMYGWMLRGKEYPIEDVYEIKKAVEEYNKRQRERYLEKLDTDNPCELVQKDMSIFDGYDFTQLERLDNIKVAGSEVFDAVSSVGS